MEKLNKINNPFDVLLEKIKHLWEYDEIFKRNQFLKIGQSTDTNLYYIKSGTIRVFVEEENEENTIRFGYPGEIIAALDSFISESPSDLYIQALKKTEVRVMKKTTFNAFITSSTENLMHYKFLLEIGILQLMERERDILTSSPRERLKRVLMRSPRLFQEIPDRYIASYLRMTPETLSRIKSLD